MLVEEENDKRTIVSLREIGDGKISVEELKKNAITRLRKEPDESIQLDEVEEEENDEFENLYKGEISKSGVPILPSKRARKIPEKIQVSNDDLAELQNTTEQPTSDPVEDAQEEEADVSLDEMKDQEETVSEATETENQE